LAWMFPDVNAKTTLRDERGQAEGCTAWCDKGPTDCFKQLAIGDLAKSCLNPLSTYNLSGCCTNLKILSPSDLAINL